MVEFFILCLAVLVIMSIVVGLLAAGDCNEDTQEDDPMTVAVKLLLFTEIRKLEKRLSELKATATSASELSTRRDAILELEIVQSRCEDLRQAVEDIRKGR